MCIFSLSYPACNAHTPYYIGMSGLSYCTTFFPRLINGTIFAEKKLLDINCVVVFSLQRLSETFLILRIQRDSLIYVHRISCKIPVILVGFQQNLNFFDILEK